MDYEKTDTFTGDPHKAMDLAVTVFTDNGFRIESKSDSTLEVIGPGWQDSKQATIRGVSRASVRITPSQIALSADFGGVRKLIRGVQILIVSLGIFFVILFYILAPHMTQRGKVHLSRGAISLLPLGSLAPWPIILPFMARAFRKRVTRELDTLVHNMSVIAGNPATTH
jgi:hypothetical protein